MPCHRNTAMLALLEVGASALGDLTRDVVFTGGAQARAEEIVLPRLTAITAAG
jgi:hypothetical protein